MFTVGWSNKLIHTLLGAVGGQVIALVVALASTGEFDRVQWAQVGGLALSALLGLVLGRQAAPDTVEFDSALEVPGGSPEVHGERE